MNPLRILVADDHEIVRRGLVSLLKSHAGWEVCAEAQDGRQAVEKAKELRPDVVILDIGMPNLNGLEAARQIHRKPRSRTRKRLTLSSRASTPTRRTAQEARPAPAP